MARITKADLEKQVQELEAQLKEQKSHYLDLLDKDNDRYIKLVEEKEGEFKSLPLYQDMVGQIDQLEKQTKADNHFINTQREENSRLKNRIKELAAENEEIKSTSDRQTKETEEHLQNKIQELMTENKELKANLNKANEVVHNARGAGRKPMSDEKVKQLDTLVKQGTKMEEVCKTLGISRATYYRIKKSL